MARLRVRGLAETRVAVARLPDGMAYELYGPMAFSLAKEIERRAKATTAFKDRTGRMRRSIKAQKTARTYTVLGRKVKVPFGAARVSVEFPSRFVEYGHGGPAPAPPHPFFRPAIRQVTSGQKGLGIMARTGARRLVQAVRRARRG